MGDTAEPMRFSLEDLKLADELCFPADFLRLFQKHTKCGDAEASLELRKFTLVYHSNLSAYINAHSRAELGRGHGKVLEAMIAELITPF